MKKKYMSLILIAAIIGLTLTTARSTQGDNAISLEITNLSGASHEFEYTQFLAMPKTVVNADLYCYGALVTYGNWSGVLLSYLLTQAQVTPEVNSIQFEASDGYKVTIPIDLAMQPQVIIAYEKDGQPLEEGLRLIIPDYNGGAWIAKITSITMSTGGTDYPPALTVEVPHANNVVTTQNSATQTAPSQQQVPTQPQPLTPQNSSGIQEATPTNVTYPHQTTTSPQVSNQSLDLQSIIVYLLGFTCAFSLAVITYVALRHRRKQVLETS